MLERRDNVIGTVSYAYGKKCFVRLKDVDCLAYFYGNATIGDQVLLTVVRNDQAEAYIKCSLDSFLQYAPLKAG